MTNAATYITDHLDTWTSSIKAKSSAGRGGGKKQEFYGIKKLRELILELAVRGLLVPQDPNDEPVTELLKRIVKEQNNLIENGLVTKRKSLSPISKNEIPFKLPQGWRWTRLSEVAHPQAGFAVKSQNFNESQQGLPLVRIRDVGQPFTGTYYDGEFREEHIINKGDYLISMDGNFRVAPWDFGKALLNQRVTRLIFFGDEIAQKFCAISLQMRLSELQGVKAYTTVDHLSGKQIADSIIALPPLAEQQRIVAKVDELMALCDKLEQQQEDSMRTHAAMVETLLGALTAASERGAFDQAWQRIASHFDTLFTTESSIDQLKQTILQLAVMGKLVEQDAGDEPAAELLNRIAAERMKLVKEGRLKKQNTLPPISKNELSTQAPSNWAYCRLNDIIQISSGDGLTAANMAENGNIPVYGGNGVNGYHDKSNVSKRTLTIGRVGYYCGAVHITPERAWVTDNAFITTFSEKNIYLEFLAWLLKGTDLKADENATAQPVISGRKLYPIIVCLPPLAEQHRIVAKVDDLMSLCNRLKARLQTAQTTQLNLADSLVEAAIH